MSPSVERVLRAVMVLVIGMLYSAVVSGGEIQVDINFPGGSGKLVALDQQTRHLEIVPSPHPDKGWACWWCVRLRGLSVGETITLEVGPSPWATPSQAATSVDGKVWKQTAVGTRRGNRIAYPIRADRDSLFVAWGPRFSVEDAERLARRAAEHEGVSLFQLARTREGRPVWGVQFDCAAEPADRQSAPYGVWIQARQHAWEAGSSWVCRGVLEWLLSDSPEAVWLKQHACVTVVPVMDVDSVAIGAGGKNQKPHDHNRDWGPHPHWPAVAAAQKRISQWDSQKRMDLFVDLHNPGASSRWPYFYITPRELLPPLATRNLDRFLATAKQEIRGPLSFRGETQESGASYDPAWRRISKSWVNLNTRAHVVAVTLETPWNTPHSHTDGYQTVGRQLGRSIARYLRTAPRE